MVTNNTTNDRSTVRRWFTPAVAFILVSFSLGQLGDGLNIFQGVYLVGLGWDEGAVGVALSLMGLTTLLVQPFAGDLVDKANIDRRIFLVVASIVTAISASTVLLMRPGRGHTTDHYIMYTSKVTEGTASSFIGPCLAALTMAAFGPKQFDAIMASNVLWGHVGSVTAALLAGWVAYISYPMVQLCFLVIGASALVAIAFVPFLPQGDPLMGRGFATTSNEDSNSNSGDDANVNVTEMHKLLSPQNSNDDATDISPASSTSDELDGDATPQAASYYEVFLDRRTCVLCFTGFFFHFANANVLLVLGEMMGGDDGGDDKGDTADASDVSDVSSYTPSRTAMPFSAGAIVMAQITMTIVTWIGDRLTTQGVGRKPLFYIGILSLPIRCALILALQNAPPTYLMMTQVFDGIGGGMMGLILPYLIADITFGTGRFNVVNGLVASFWGCGATLSNFLGQMVVQHYGHEASLIGSFVLSLIPCVIFALMPETIGARGEGAIPVKSPRKAKNGGSNYQSFDV